VWSIIGIHCGDFCENRARRTEETARIAIYLPPSDAIIPERLQWKPARVVASLSRESRIRGILRSRVFVVIK